MTQDSRPEVKGFIDDETYKKILDSMPVACVDVVIQNEKGEILLAKRKNKPEKGKWWVVGGRVYKNETIIEAAKRKVKEEVGIDVEIKKVLGCGETIFDNAEQEGSTSHTINTYVLTEPVIEENIQINLKGEKSDLEDYKFSDKSIDENPNPYLKQIFEDYNKQK